MLFIASVISMVYLIFISFFTGDEIVREYSHQFEIQALSDSQAHIVSRYSVDNQHRYYFVRNLDEGKKTGWIKSNDSVLIESDDENPRIEVYREYPKYGKWVTKYILENEKFIANSAISKHYKIYIPRGSVTEEFDVDLN